MAIAFTATFNPSPDPPDSYPFLLTGADGSPVSNLFVVPVGEEVSISITLAPGASFALPGSGPIAWSLKPDVEVVYILSGSTLTFTVPAPTHILHPWVFRFIADVGDVKGARSQNIYVAKTFVGALFALRYTAENGNFSLVDVGSEPGAEGVDLGAELVMVNTQLYGVNVVVSLESDIPGVQFAPPGINWSTPPSTAGISFIPPTSPTSTLSFLIDEAAMGTAVSFQFAIALGELTILSPDPILINSTIGDG